MRKYLAAGLAAGLMMTGALIATAPLASAGCMPMPISRIGEPPRFLPGQMCDGPIQSDGSWQRCEIWDEGNGATLTGCFPMGAGHAPPLLSYQPPLTRIAP